MASQSTGLRRALITLVTTSLAAISMAALPAAPASAAAGPAYNVVDRPASAVTGDPLPTVQIDGVVWDQAIAGDTVFAGGRFANARPAGAASGTNLIPRRNLLSYNIRTGVLNSGFNHVIGAGNLPAKDDTEQIRAMAVSPDKTRLYIAGSFLSVDGQTRNRIAAFNVADGSLISSFAPVVNGPILALAVTNTTVYFGGAFGTVNGNSRRNLAAVGATNGVTTGWTPTADYQVNSMTRTPDGSRIIVGGMFTNMNNSPVYGLASLDAANGTLYPLLANNVIRDYGTSSAIYSLKSDATNIYGTGYWFGGTGNFEGPFVMDPMTGAIKAMADCHGDTYDSSVVGSTLYSVSHHHDCTNIGGFPDTNPRSRWQRANAFTIDATTTVKKNSDSKYANFEGQPSPSIVAWFPDVPAGTFSGQGQGGWTSESTSEYLVQGGEFARVSGKNGQGLVRFAIPSLAPKKEGPAVAAADSAPTARGLSSDTIRVSWPANFDRDDQSLTYKLYRTSTANPTGVLVSTLTNVISQFWNRPTQVYVDSGLTPGETYGYYVEASDPNNNKLKSTTTSATTSAAVVDNSNYSKAVQADGASHYWRLNDASGTTTATDWAGANDLVLGTGVALGAPGAVNGSPDQAATFSGTSTGTSGTTTLEPGTNTFTTESWFKTTTTRGGKIIGFGNSQLGSSNNYDRQVYMDNSGRLYFGVCCQTGPVQTVNTTGTYNNGAWHQVVSSLSAERGMQLYVDGVLQASKPSISTAQAFNGYWRVGGDNLASWPGTKTSNFLAGTIDDVAIYPTALTSTQVGAHYQAATGVNAAPVAAFTSSCTDGTCLVDGTGSNDPDGTIASYAWTFGDGGTATTAVASHPYAVSGTYPVTLTVTDNSGKSTTLSRNVAVTVPPANQDPTVEFTNTCVERVCTFDSSATTDPDGTIASYAWDFADTTTSTEANPAHTFAADGTYAVKLTVTDNRGSVKSVTHSVTVQTPNQSPSAAFTSTTDGAKATFDASGSTDPDGTIASYAWTFGDGKTGTGVNPSHTYTASGTYDVTLTVTDNRGGTNQVTKSVTVTVPANQAPTARFTATTSDLKVSVDGTTSTDSDGSVASYAWKYGDSSTGTGSADTHTYSEAGTYTVTLTVTDNEGATDVTTKSVTVTAAPVSDVVAKDTFSRTTSKWGTADTGGTWTDAGSTYFSTNGSKGIIKLTKAGAGPIASLSSASVQNSITKVEFAADKAGTGGGNYLTLSSRRIGTSEYRLTARLMPDGSVRLGTGVIVSGTQVASKEVVVSNLTYAPGDVLNMSFSVTGNGTTTLAGKVWKASASEPAAAQVTSTNTEATLQAAGYPALQGYLSGSSTNAPVVLSLDNYAVTRTN